MTNSLSAEVDCKLVGQFVDDGGHASSVVPSSGEVVRTRMVATYQDLWRGDDGLREFTVLLKDGRSIAIRGNGLMHALHPVAGEDVFSIVVRDNDKDVIIALFKCNDVAGIFDGEIQAERRIA